jgi:murein DD-endopeptidase MepM/ murein hydrolase activator NlpD
MNRTNNFKKVEKSVFVYIVNVLSLIKKFLSSIVGFFINSGSQKITIMMIPHNEKRVFNFKLNVFALFIIFLFTSSGLGIILFLTVANFNTSLKYKDASIKTQINEKRSREYEELLNEILDNHNIFKGKLNVLMSKLNSNSLQNIMDDEYFKNQGGAPNLVDFSGLDEFERERAEVDRLLGDYRKSIIAFSEINKMADNYNKILKDMPYGCPVKGFYTITSTFGFRIHPIHKVLDMHTGLDMAYQAGTPIVSTAPGIVDKVDFDAGGYGWYIKISHTKGFSTLYAHMRSQPIVSPGDKVKKGQIIGYMGSTGSSTGTHVHYEVKLGNVLLDPWQFVSNN